MYCSRWYNKDAPDSYPRHPVKCNLSTFRAEDKINIIQNFEKLQHHEKGKSKSGPIFVREDYWEIPTTTKSRPLTDILPPASVNPTITHVIPSTPQPSSAQQYGNTRVMHRPSAQNANVNSVAAPVLPPLAIELNPSQAPSLFALNLIPMVQRAASSRTKRLSE